jgi:Lecithin retinol acyltransferase
MDYSTNYPEGAHVVTPRRAYRHHGIYIGGGKVVHYAGLQRGLRRGPVEEVTIEEFAKGHPIQLLPGALSTFHSHEVVQRARSRVGENEWRLLTNNCEHFCEWCVRGEARSYQAEALLSLPGRLLREVWGSIVPPLWHSHPRRCKQDSGSASA